MGWGVTDTGRGTQGYEGENRCICYTRGAAATAAHFLATFGRMLWRRFDAFLGGLGLLAGGS